MLSWQLTRIVEKFKKPKGKYPIEGIRTNTVWKQAVTSTEIKKYRKGHWVVAVMDRNSMPH